jgi:hypothetical protein
MARRRRNRYEEIYTTAMSGLVCCTGLFAVLRNTRNGAPRQQKKYLNFIAFFRSRLIMAVLLHAHSERYSVVE